MGNGQSEDRIQNCNEISTMTARLTYRCLIQEPGDMFIADLDPKHHSNLEDASGSRMRLEDALFHHLRDFSSLYGMAFGNMHMRKTGFWFVWDVAKLHEDIRERVKSQGQYITYGSDGKKPQIGSGKGKSPRLLECDPSLILFVSDNRMLH